MDTSGNPYDNILKALGGAANPGAPAKYQAQMDNYTLFSKLTNEGISLQDLINKAAQVDELKERMDKLDKNQPSLDLELFSVMEAAVKNDDSVKAARQRVADEKTRVITELCSKDERYREAYGSYRTAVNAAYVRQKEQAEDRSRLAPVRDDAKRGVQDQEGLSCHEEV